MTQHRALEQTISSPSCDQTGSSSSRTLPLDPFAPGAYYERQFRAKEEGAALDVFAVFGLPADNPVLTQRGARQHFRKQVA